MIIFIENVQHWHVLVVFSFKQYNFLCSTEYNYVHFYKQKILIFFITQLIFVEQKF